MTNSYTPLDGIDKLSPSRTKINNSIETILTSSSGSSAPSTYTYAGRLFFSTNSEYLAIRTNTNWKDIIDCSSSTPRAFDSRRLGGIEAINYVQKNQSNTYASPQILANNIALQGKKANGSSYNIAYINTADHTIVGNTSTTLDLYYPKADDAPRVFNGTTSYKIFHEGYPPASSGGGDPVVPGTYLGLYETAADSKKLSGKLPWSIGNNYNSIPYLDQAGIMEVGTAIDFHDTTTDTKSYSARLSTFWIDHTSYPTAGLILSTKSTDFSAALDVRANITLGKFNNHYYTKISAISNSGFPESTLATVGSTGRENGFLLVNPDRPELAHGKALTYTVDLKSVPVIESWIYGTGVFKAYTNTASQIGFQFVAASTNPGTSVGSATFGELSNVYFALVSVHTGAGGYIGAANIVNISGNVVHFSASVVGTDVTIMAFGAG